MCYLRSGQKVANSKVDGALIPIVLETDHTSVEGRKGLQHLVVGVHQVG